MATQLIELKFVLVYGEGGKMEKPEGFPGSKDKTNQQQTLSTYDTMFNDSSPGHTGGRSELSPRCYTYSLNI